MGGLIDITCHPSHWSILTTVSDQMVRDYSHYSMVSIVATLSTLPAAHSIYHYCSEPASHAIGDELLVEDLRRGLGARRRIREATAPRGGDSRGVGWTWVTQLLL